MKTAEQQRVARELRRTALLRRLESLAPKHRLEAMLEEVDGRALVRSLPAEEVYSAIVEVGLSDSAEVVQLGSPAQFRTWVDLAAWQRDRMDPVEVLRWLQAARGSDDAEYIRKVQALDLEVLELLFQKLTALHDLQENPDVNPEGVTMETPEGAFLIEFKVDGPDEAALRRLTEDLTAHNPFELARFLEAVRWELPTELEEAAWQFRQARLEDLGFPPLEQAMRLFSWVDPGAGPQVASSQSLASPTHVDHVSAAFQGLSLTERSNLETEVRYLVNCVLVAERAEPGDPRSVRRLSEHARDYLDLGLEHLTGGHAQLASEVVRARPLKEIFQVGFSLTLQLKRQVDRLAGEPGARFGDTWLALDEESGTLEALTRRRPLRALKVAGAEPVPFRSRRELVEAEAAIARSRGQRDVLVRLLSASPAEVIGRFGVTLAELRPQRMFSAAVARAEVDQVLEVAPFPEGRLVELCERLFEPGATAAARSSAGKRAYEVLHSALPEATELSAMVERVLSSFVVDFGVEWARAGRIDARRVNSLPIAGLFPT